MNPIDTADYFDESTEKAPSRLVRGAGDNRESSDACHVHSCGLKELEVNEKRSFTIDNRYVWKMIFGLGRSDYPWKLLAQDWVVAIDRLDPTSRFCMLLSKWGGTPDRKESASQE